MPLPWTLFATSRGQEPAIRPRFETQRSTLYELTGDDVETWPDLTLSRLSRKFYGSLGFEDVILDANPLKPPWEWVVGDQVVIPLDHLRAAAQIGSPALQALVRRFR
jgi:hypothetical protein